jgi:predicted ATPase
MLIVVHSPAPIEPSALGLQRAFSIRLTHPVRPAGYLACPPSHDPRDPRREEFAVPSYILTGTPGAGKTAVLRLLEASGYPVVEEAATDVIALGNALGRAEPWHEPDFIDKVITLQRHRQDSVRAAGCTAVFFDRSPVCTLALSRYLGFTPSPLLNAEVSRVLAEGTYEPIVFFIRNQGFVQPTAARQISFEDSLVFERLHEQTYHDLGFQLVEVPAGPLADRVKLIRQTVSQRRQPG